jgi:hypothetical protein
MSDGGESAIYYFNFKSNEAKQFQGGAVECHSAGPQRLPINQQSPKREQGATVRPGQTLQEKPAPVPRGVGSRLPQNIQNISRKGQQENASEVLEACDRLFHRDNARQ